MPGFTFLSSWESGEAASGLPYPTLCEVCPCSIRMPVTCSQPCGICPQGMQDMPAAWPQPLLDRVSGTSRSWAQSGASRQWHHSGCDKASGARPGKLAWRCCRDKHTDIPGPPWGGCAAVHHSAAQHQLSSCRGLLWRRSVPVHTPAPGWAAKSR